MNRSIRIVATLVVLMAGAFAVNGCGPAPATVVYTEPPATTVPNIAGDWTTHWGGDEICMLQLQQNGASIGGRYTTTGAPPGTVNGTLDGNVLSGSWSDQAGGGGMMVLTFADDGSSFNGTWGSGTSTTSGGSWSGTR